MSMFYDTLCTRSIPMCYDIVCLVYIVSNAVKLSTSAYSTVQGNPDQLIHKPAAEAICTTCNQMMIIQVIGANNKQNVPNCHLNLLIKLLIIAY